MTIIKFFKNKGDFVAIESSGHTGFSTSGKDILCASISGIIQTGLLGLNNVLKSKLNYNLKDGYIKYQIPSDISNSIKHDCQIIMQTMYLGLKDLEEGYSKYISMEVIENVY